MTIMRAPTIPSPVSGAGEAGSGLAVTCEEKLHEDLSVLHQHYIKSAM